MRIAQTYPLPMFHIEHCGRMLHAYALCVCNQLCSPLLTLQDASMRQREQRPRLTGLSPLHTYLADLMSFHIACLKTWVARRAGSSAGLPQHVPCIRHFLDWRPCNLLLLLYMITCTATVSAIKACVAQNS